VLDPHVSTKGEMGRVVLTALGIGAQMKRRFIKERQRERIAPTKGEGVHMGEQALSGPQGDPVSHEAGHGVAQIAMQLGSRMQVRVLAEWESSMRMREMTLASRAIANIRVRSNTVIPRIKNFGSRVVHDRSCGWFSSHHTTSPFPWKEPCPRHRRAAQPASAVRGPLLRSACDPQGRWSG
jgi:hypothetical protein